jgi:hypothetical protein
MNQLNENNTNKTLQTITQDINITSLFLYLKERL